MSVRDGTDRRVSFKTQDELGDKIDKLTVVMSKLAAKDSHERKPLKPQVYKSRGQSRSYGQGGYQAGSDNGNRGYSVNNSSRQNYRGNSRGYGRQNNRENYRNERYGNNNRDRNRSRERTITGTYGNRRDRSSSNDRSRSGSRASTNHYTPYQNVLLEMDSALAYYSYYLLLWKYTVTDSKSILWYLKFMKM